MLNGRLAKLGIPPANTTLGIPPGRPFECTANTELLRLRLRNHCSTVPATQACIETTARLCRRFDDAFLSCQITVLLRIVLYTTRLHMRRKAPYENLVYLFSDLPLFLSFFLALTVWHTPNLMSTPIRRLSIALNTNGV